MAEALRAIETPTSAAVSHEKRESRKFWNRWIGKSAIVLGVALVLSVLVPPTAPLAALNLINLAAGGAILAGGWGIGGRLLAEAKR